MEDIIGPLAAFEPMPEPVVLEHELMPEPVSVVIPGAALEMTAEICVLPTPAEAVPVAEAMQDAVSAVIPGAHFEVSAEIVVLPHPVRGRKRAMWEDAPLRDFMVAAG